jgi:hypothetical protein
MPTNFLYYAGTSGPPNTGNLVSAFTVMSTDLTSTGTLASSQTAVSASSNIGNLNGVFNSSMYGQGIWADLFLTHGTSVASAMSAGANVAGWWMTSPDAGTTFESIVGASYTPLPRPPDFLIPHPATTINAGLTFKSAGIVRIPALVHKVFLQNNTGQTIFSSVTAYPTLKVAPFAMQY